MQKSNVIAANKNQTRGPNTAGGKCFITLNELTLISKFQNAKKVLG